MRRWIRLELHRRQGHWFWPPVVLFAIVAYVPLLLTRPGRVSGDTLDGLYVDPTRTFLDAATRWDPGVSFGAVVDRTFGPAFPMSPYYWLAHVVGVPTWMAQRVWMGTILFVAALGVVAMLRVMAWDGPAWVVAPLAYISSPYVLSQLGIQSVTLLAFAALPWLVALTVTALEGTSPNRWREPARIGVIVALTASGSISAFLGVLPGPLLWILYVVAATREVPWRRAAALLGRTAVTSCAVSAWWLIGLLSRPRAEVAFVRQRDPARRVASASIPSETIRGLGDWRFYAHVGRSALDAGYAYQRVGIVILLTFVPLAMALLTLGRHRFHNRIYFVGLLAVGVVLSSGMSPARHPEAYGRLLQDITSTSVGSFLLPTSRCAPLTALAIAFAFAAGIRYIAETVPDRSRVVTICASALAMAMVPAFYTGHSLDGPLLLEDEVPQYWRDAAADLDDPGHHGYGVLEVPGLSAPEYEWGTTRQPISSSLIRRTVALRTPDWPSQPAPANLIAAIDEAGSSEGQLEPQAIVALARLLGIDSILLRLDTPDEQAAAEQWRAKLDRATGLGILDKHEPYTDDEAPDPQKPRLIVYTVPEKARLPLVRLIDPQYGIVVAGTGPAVVSLANRGLITGREAVQYSGTMDDSDFRKLPVTTPVIVTDSSRWTMVSDDDADPLVEPFTSPLEPARVIRSDQPTPLPHAPQAVYSSTVFADGLAIGATSYHRHGVVDVVSRPANAFDGDPQTTWLTPAGIDPRDDTLTVAVTSGRQKFGGNYLVIRQAPGPGRILRIAVTAGGAAEEFALDESSVGPAGQSLTLASAPASFTKLEVRILKVDRADDAVRPSNTRVGFAEVRLVGDRLLDPDVRDHSLELTDVPTDINEMPRLASHPLAYLFERWRGALDDEDPETRIVRRFELASARTFSVSATIRGVDSSQVPPECATTALKVDGKWVRLAFTVPESATARATGSETLSLPSGTHVLETDGACGVTLDSVLLNDGVGPLAGPAPAVAAVEVDQTSATSYQLQVGFVREPTWLTIGASFDSDWRGGGLTDLGAAKLLNGYAASWQLDQVVDEKFIFTARWTPQRAVNVGVIFSTIALLVLSAISLIPGWRRSNRSDLIALETLRAGNSNIVVLAVLGGFGIAAGAIPAIVAGGAALLLELRPRYHRRIAWSAPALLGVVAVTKVVHATIGDNPTRIRSLAGPAWIEVLTYTALALAVTAALANTERPPVKRYPTDLM